MPRVQHEGIVKLLAADFSDDATLAATLAGLGAEFDAAEAELDAQLERIPDVPHRARYLRLINDYGRRMLDAQRAWLQEVDRELGR